VHVVSGKAWLAVPGYVGQALRASLGLAISILTMHASSLAAFRESHSYIVYLTLITSVVVRELRYPICVEADAVIDGRLEYGGALFLSALS
jgi:hypothetical protein